MLQRDYPDQVCSIARSLEVVGERWTLLILRDAVVGLTRFEEFQAKLGIASNVLTNRLKRLCDEDVLERVMDSEGLLLGEEVIRVMTNIKKLDANPGIAAAQKTGQHRQRDRL